MSGIEGFSTAMLLGPLGGIVALAYAAGAASGWGFCVLTVLRITNRQITRLEGELASEKADCARRLAALETRVKEVEDRYTHGMERQLGQIRDSSLRNLMRRDDD
jgi:hypothetical protein